MEFEKFKSLYQSQLALCECSKTLHLIEYKSPINNLILDEIVKISNEYENTFVKGFCWDKKPPSVEKAYAINEYYPHDITAKIP